MSVAQVVAGPTSCFDVVVASLRRLSPSFLRVTLAGSALADLDPCGPLGPRDLRVKLLVPHGDRPPSPITDLGPGWYPRWLARDPHERGELRTYTIRSIRGDGPDVEVDVDVVLHDDAAGAPGPAARWARTLAVGDRVLLLGPNRHSEEPYGGIAWRPPPLHLGRGRVVLVADETAVPAVASILATLPDGYDARAILEVPTPEDFLQLRIGPEVEVTWLARGHQPRGVRLAAAVSEAVGRGTVSRATTELAEHDAEDDVWETPEDLGLVPGSAAPYVWIAGESGVVRALRRQLVGELGLPRSSIAFMGYWRA